MQWVSAVSSDADCERAARIASEEVIGQLDGQPPDLVFFFVSVAHREVAGMLQEIVRAALRCEVIVGCTAHGVIGRSLEIEDGPAISISAAVIPGVNVEVRHIDFMGMPDADAAQSEWREWFEMGGSEQIIVLADPFNTELEDFLAGLDYAYPEACKVGGLASAADKAGGNTLFFNDQTFKRGGLLIGLSGNIVMDTIVAQGCRPIGPVAMITQCDGNVIHALSNQPALDYLRNVHEELKEDDRELFKSGLFLGVTTDPFVTEPIHGDYLIRNLMGIDYQSGAIIMAGVAQEGALVQLHVRDSRSSALDLEYLLKDYREAHGEANIKGGLLFSCVGRGKNLYGSVNHDCDLIAKELGSFPVGGFFCAGEIGTVGPATFIHGYTSSIAVFRAKDLSAE